MAWYRRTKLAWGTLLRSVQNSINLGSSQTPNLKRYCLQVEDRFRQKGYNYKRRIAGLGLASINLDSSQTPNLKRYCLHRFRQKGYNYKRWIGGLGLAGAVYATNLETIPYTKRTHLVLVPRVLERKLLGEFTYRLTKKLEGWKVLPATHPTSARVKSIADNVIEAVMYY